ncbi:hypothetical protein [Herbaspirillum sp. ST 5-3]|uniref:hypothetical protein n=1 Tax=Oxalobacteraceae TaxID=75682 RepID=UPI0010A404F2|nr:hypothetical protein [Herbaspirillum sp. ST 5-3]
MEIDLPRFVNGVREFVLGQLHGNLTATCYDSVRAVDPAWLANVVLESQGQPLPTKPQIYISETELDAFNRFCECCEDSDADGHDVPKEMMARLCKIGLVRSCGFGKHETTRYGDAIRCQASENQRQRG